MLGGASREGVVGGTVGSPTTKLNQIDRKEWLKYISL